MKTHGNINPLDEDEIEEGDDIPEEIRMWETNSKAMHTMKHNSIIMEDGLDDIDIEESIAKLEDKEEKKSDDEIMSDYVSEEFEEDNK